MALKDMSGMDYFYGAFLVFLELDSLIWHQFWHLRHSATSPFVLQGRKKRRSLT